MQPDPVRVYLDSLAPGSKRAALESLKKILSLGGGGSIHDYPWETLKSGNVLALQSILREKHSPAYVNKIIGLLIGLLRTYWHHGLISSDEIARIRGVRPIQHTRLPKGRALTETETKSLLEAIKNERHRLIVRLMLSTGIRRSEAAHIMWDDFCSDGLRIHGKGNKERIVPVPPFIVGAVYQACLGRKGEMVFGVGGDGIAAVLRKASREAGIPIVTPHDLRRTFATRALRQLPVVVVQKLMGHSSPTTTAGYDRTRLDELTEMVRGTDLWSV